MRKLLFVALWVNLAFEGLVGVMLLLSPYMGEAFDVTTQMFSVHYGMAAILIASMVFWTWRFGKTLEGMTVCLGILSVFHTLLTTSSLILFSLGADLIPAILHGVLAATFIFLFVNRTACLRTTV